MIKHVRRLAAATAAVTALLALGCGEARKEQDQAFAGLRLTIESASLNAANQVEVTYRLTGASGVPRGRSGVTNNWTLAGLVADPNGVPNVLAYQSFVLTGGQSYVLKETLERPDLPEHTAGQTVKQPGVETEIESTAGTKDLGNGRFVYTFAAKVPAGFPRSGTLRVGVFSQLQTNPGQTPAQLDPDRPNVTFDFTPNGGSAESRELVSDAACNTCHGEVRAHGGGRRGVKICTTCHTTQLFDPDTIDPAKLSDVNAVTAAGKTEPANPLDLGRLVHRIHRGRGLQTVANVLRAVNAAAPADRAALLANPFAKYSVVGFRNSDNVYGQVRTRTENGVTSSPYAYGVAFPPPNDVRNCEQCHQGAKDAGQHVTTVERRICTGCHADVVFDAAQKDTVGTPAVPLHIVHTTPNGEFPITNDSSCFGCHSQSIAPADAPEFSRYVGSAHVVPLKSGQLKGLKVEIVDLANAAPGQKPTITFKVTNGDGTPVAALSELTTLRATVNGPTTDYLYWNNYFQENLLTGSTPVDAAAGTWSHPFVGAGAVTGAIAASATGTWAVGIEGRRSVPLANADEPTPPVTQVPTTVNESLLPNPIRYFNPQGGTPEPRKLAVSWEKCNSCHLALTFHGNLRSTPEYCVMCHTPDDTDWSRRAGTAPAVDLTKQADNREEQSIHLKPMIHRIHTGKELQLQKPYVIAGGFFDEGGLPAEAQSRCDTCHTNDDYKLERMPAGRQPTFANATSTILHPAGDPDPKNAGPTARIQPMTSACVSCHDTQQAFDHAAQFTTPQGERCVECHADGGVRAVSAVHAVAGKPIP